MSNSVDSDETEPIIIACGSERVNICVNLHQNISLFTMIKGSLLHK